MMKMENKVTLADGSILTMGEFKVWRDEYFRKAGYKDYKDFQIKQEMLTKEEEANLMEDFKEALILAEKRSKDKKQAIEESNKRSAARADNMEYINFYAVKEEQELVKELVIDKVETKELYFSNKLVEDKEKELLAKENQLNKEREEVDRYIKGNREYITNKIVELDKRELEILTKEELLADKVVELDGRELGLDNKENFLVKKSESLTNKINLYRTELNNFNLAVDAFNKEKQAFLAEKAVMKEEVAKVVLTSDSFTKAFKKVDKEFEAARISRYQSEAESEEKLKLRIGYDKRSYNGFINKEDSIILMKGEDKKEFKIADALFVNNEKGFINSESGYEYPIMMRIHGNNKEYEAFSLTLSMFDEYLGDSFNRYGVYFINGLGLFTLTLKNSGLELIYQKGNNHKDVANYLYSVPNVADKKISVRKIAEIVENNVEELLTEGVL